MDIVKNVDPTYLTVNTLLETPEGDVQAEKVYANGKMVGMVQLGFWDVVRESGPPPLEFFTNLQ